MKKLQFMQSGYFILLTSFFVVFLFAVFNIFTIKHFNQRIEEIYKNSLNYSSNYWADQFYVANRELTSLINKNDGTDYNLICDSSDPAFIAERSSDLQRDLTNLSLLNDNRIVYFVFIPDKDMMLSSISYLDYFQETENEELKKYILNNQVNNSAAWKDIKLGDNYYFLHLYEHKSGFGGCYISCEHVLRDIMPQDQESNVSLLNMDGSVFYAEKDAQEYKNYFVFSRAIRMINKKISIEIPHVNFVSSGSYLFIIIIIAIAASILLITIALFYQEQSVFKPLTKLKKAMEEFSGGNTQVRLNDRTSNHEIKVLYHTFNHMAEQIINLKIDVYKASLEKQKVYNQFLRVQIQPHFYTNILNLIYTLASIKDYGTIKDLTKNMAEYFRYLLSLKEDYVFLEDELQCIARYAQVQKIRYQDNFQMKITCNADADTEKIPPLLIQTFIENSIKHNIMLVQDLEIILVIEEAEDMLCIIVKDNGLGFPEGILDKLNRDEDIEEDGRHIGIMNVKNRLEVLYQGKAIVSIQNENKGSRVAVSIPRIRKEENTQIEYITC